MLIQVLQARPRCIGAKIWQFVQLFGQCPSDRLETAVHKPNTGLLGVADGKDLLIHGESQVELSRDEKTCSPLPKNAILTTLMQCYIYANKDGR